MNLYEETNHTSLLALTLFALFLALLALALRSHVFFKGLELVAPQVLRIHALELPNLQLDLAEVPHDHVVVVTATEQLIVREGHAHHSVAVTQELIEALLGLNVPNTNRIVVARSEQPFVENLSVFVPFAVSVDCHDPALVSDELFNVALYQVVRSDDLVTATDKEPLVVQMEAVDCVLRCDERLVNLACLEVDSSDNLVPGARKKQVHVLMHNGAIHRITEFVDSDA